MAEAMSITRFSGKVLLATGGGSGIGAAAARQFAAEGGRVAVLDLTAERAEQIAEQLDGSIGIACDVSDESAVEAAVAATVERLGRVDAVLNSAGHVHFAPIEELTLADWNNDAGGAPHRQLPRVQGRAPSTARRRRWRDRERRLDRGVCAPARISPPTPRRREGSSRSRASSRSTSQPTACASTSSHPEASERRSRLPFSASTAARRRSSGGSPEPEEIAATVCFLLSSDSSFYTGALFTPDGGQTAL